MKTYNITFDGKLIDTYDSDKMYYEFEKPFFEAFPKYKGCAVHFDHVNYEIPLTKLPDNV